MPQPEKDTPRATIMALDDAESTLGDRLMRRAKRVLGNVSSPRGLTALLGVLTFLILSFILGFDYLAVEKTVENGLSKRAFVAPYALEVVDQAETDRQQYAAQLNVEASPVYLPREVFNRKILENKRSVLAQLARIRSDVRLQSLSDKRQAFNSIALLADNPYREALFEGLLHAGLNDSDWDHFTLATDFTVDQILKAGVSRDDYFQSRDALIRRALPPALRPSVARPVSQLVWSVILPTMVVDDQEMMRLRREAADQVSPVVHRFAKGEKIVGKGERMTPVQEAALEKIGKSIKGVNGLACLGVMVLCALFTTTVWTYMRQFNRGEFFRPGYGLLVMTLTTAFSAAYVMIQRWAMQSDAAASPYFFPLATYALTLAIFMHPRLGAFMTAMLVFLMALTLKTGLPTLTVLLIGSLVGIYILTRKVNFCDRGQLMWAGLYISLTNMALIVAVSLTMGTGPVLHTHHWISMAADATWGLMGGFLSAALTIGILPFLESVFRLVSPYTLLELGNHDNPLLKRMQYEAPGTFHHSLMVASLSEAAAETIGANALLTRVGSLYHDIGKMKRPLFFIENQAYFGAENPHDKLTPRLSKMVITAHPRDSLEMARHHHLPEMLMDFMTEHHGTMLAGFFYNQACLQEGKEHVSKSQFRYPGPKPQSRETAIVMMADACESAVRALKNPTVGQIEERIDKIVQARIDDGQFDNCPITFRDIQLVKETFVRVLRGIQHHRIEYQQTVIKELGKKLPDPAASRPAPATLPQTPSLPATLTVLPPSPEAPPSSQPG